jgi:hypothetical protein
MLLLLHAHTLTPPSHNPLASYPHPSPLVPPSPVPPSVCEASTLTYAQAFALQSPITPTPFLHIPPSTSALALSANKQHL